MHKNPGSVWKAKYQRKGTDNEKNEKLKTKTKHGIDTLKQRSEFRVLTRGWWGWITACSITQDGQKIPHQ